MRPRRATLKVIRKIVAYGDVRRSPIRFDLRRVFLHLWSLTMLLHGLMLSALNAAMSVSVNQRVSRSLSRRDRT